MKTEISKIKPNPNNARKYFDKISELAEDKMGEIIKKNVVKRKPGHIYYVDVAGNVCETEMARRRKKDEDIEKIEEQIKKLREQGKKLVEISKITGKSIYFIYSRLNPKYKLGQLEISYIDKKVIPYLKEKGFTNIDRHCLSDWITHKEKYFYADIVAEKDNTFHIFEVKKTSQSSLLNFAIGEIIIGRMSNNKIKGQKKYHIILPKNKMYDESMRIKSNFLKKEYDMDIILI